MIYTFGEFMLRPATWFDLPLATEWTANDPDHDGITPPAFWTQYKPGTINSFLLLRKEEPVFFFRIDQSMKNATEKMVEIHIQFCGPHALLQSLTRRGIVEGFEWLEKMLKESGFEGYYFHSRNSQLIFWCQGWLGFEWDGTKLWRDLRKKIHGNICSDLAVPLLDSLLGDGATATIWGGGE